VGALREKFSLFFLKYKERIGIVGVGHATITVVNHWFDLVLYPYVICSLGLTFGVTVMIAFALVLDVIIIYVYDKTKLDWLGIETAKDLQNDITNKFAKAVLKWTHNKGDMVTTIALSFWIDAFIVTLYMRNGAYKYNGFSLRDWKIFLTATVVGNVYWAVLVLLGIEGVEFVLGTASCAR
jgi:hypothetical protein